MRVVLDTNVVMSGIFFGGVPGKILAAWSAGGFSLAMAQQHDGSNPRALKPDFAAYDGLRERKRGFIDAIVGFLQSRPTADVAIVAAILALFLLARDFAVSRDGWGYSSALACAAMILTIALIAMRKRVPLAKNRQRCRNEPAESGDQRRGARSPGAPSG